MSALLEALAVTAEVCGGEPMSAAAAKVMLMDLAGIPEPKVIAALTRVRREHKGRLSLAAIFERIDDGRIGADEAWAAVPKDERETGVLTAEMFEAWEAAEPLYSDGDKVGARMAFRDAYNRACERNKAEGKPVDWRVSLGWEQKGRAEALASAVRLGRLTVDDACRYVANTDELLALVDGRTPKAIAAPVKNMLPDYTGFGVRK